MVDSGNLLRFEDRHISTAEDELKRNIWHRNLGIEDPHTTMESYLTNVRFYNVTYTRHWQKILMLVTTLVKCWRSKTYIFHFLCKECTITLEEVALQLDLPMDKRIVIGNHIVGKGCLR
ncbi:hypothetical protein Gorai_000286, partial [Gossypium raimondii]|nr:hypothetical protein [Gossypium raimondii]